MFKGKQKNDNLCCFLKWIRVSRGCGRRGLPAGRFGGWAGDSSPQGGEFGLGGAAGLRRAPVPLWLSLEPRSPLLPEESPGAQWGSHFPWFVESRFGIFPCTGIGWSEVDLELLEDGVLSPMLILT